MLWGWGGILKWGGLNLAGEDFQAADVQGWRSL